MTDTVSGGLKGDDLLLPTKENGKDMSPVSEAREEKLFLKQDF